MHTEDIWNIYRERLFAFILSRVKDPILAEDLSQIVFVKIHTKLGTLKDSEKLESWLFQVTRNTILDFFRKEKKDRERTNDIPPVFELDDAEKARRELSACLLPMIDRLPDLYRRAILLSEIENKTQKEVAQLEGISLSGAKSRVQRGRAMLKTMLGQCCTLELDRNASLISFEPNSKTTGCDTC